LQTLNSKKGFLLSSEVNELRRETPSCSDKPFFNNAGSSLMPKIVYEAHLEYLELEFKLGAYKAAEDSKRKLKRTHRLIAEFINAEEEEIALFENSSYAWQRLVRSLNLQKNDEILFHSSEYSSNYFFLKKLEDEVGIKLIQVPSNGFGEIDIVEMEKSINENTRLICLTHMPTGNGLVQPADLVGKIAKQKKILYILDACQSVGQFPVDIKKIQCDFLCASGRKYLRSARGTGFLYIRRDLIKSLNLSFIDLNNIHWEDGEMIQNSQNAQVFEFWETSKANQIVLAESIQYMLDIGINRIREQVDFIASSFRKRFHDFPKINPTDQGRIKSGIITFNHSKIKTSDLYRALKKEFEVSMVKKNFTHLSFKDRGINDDLIRVSVHYFNTRQEVELFFEELKKIEESFSSL